MRNLVVAFDLDRVVFDTNTYVKKIDERLEEFNLSVENIFSNLEERKDLSALFSYLEKQFGKKKADDILFSDVQKYLSQEVKQVANFLSERGIKVVIISVGDGYQERKVEDFSHAEIHVVQNDFQKVNKAKEIGVDVFIDDKIKVVEEMRLSGIKAFQALWFLDEKHKKNTLSDALNNPQELKTRLKGIFND